MKSPDRCADALVYSSSFAGAVEQVPTPEILTGIKAIDLLCPFTKGGKDRPLVSRRGELFAIEAIIGRY